MKPVTRRTILIALMSLLVAGGAASLRAQTWNVGDVFVAIGGGQYQVWHFDFSTSPPTATLVQTITDSFAKGGTAGCGFDSLFNLYTTNFDNSTVFKFDASSHALLQSIQTGVPSNSASPESIVFDSSGNFYVGHADSLSSGKVVKGGGKLEKYSAAGAFQTSFSPTAENRGTDWIDLANDQRTLFYTSEGVEVLKFDVAMSTQLIPPFATLPSGTGPAFAIRLLPRVDSTGTVFLDGSGGLLVADTTNIKRLNSSGSVIQSYGSGLANNPQFVALALDPNGTSFWAGDAKNSNFYRFSLASGALEVGPIFVGSSKNIGGMCVKGELRLNIVPLSYSTGTNVAKFAGFGAPNTNNFHTWSATFGQVLSPFTIAVSATEGIDLARFDEYFCNQAEPGTGAFNCVPPLSPSSFQQTLKPITYGDQVNATGAAQPGQPVVYRVENPPPPTSYSSTVLAPILLYVGFHPPSTASYTPLTCPGSTTPTSSPRLFRDPSSSPPTDAASNHSFAFDFTTSVSLFSKLGDPITGQVGGLNDYVIADRCPSVPGATATFNSPAFKAKVKSGSAIPLKITVVDGNGNPVLDAVTFPNDITLSISLLGGPVERTFFVPGSSHSFFTGLGKGVYGANLDTTGLSVGLTALCLTSVDKSDASGLGTSTGQGEFPPACTQINIVP